MFVTNLWSANSRNSIQHYSYISGIYLFLEGHLLTKLFIRGQVSFIGMPNVSQDSRYPLFRCPMGHQIAHFSFHMPNSSQNSRFLQFICPIFPRWQISTISKPNTFSSQNSGFLLFTCQKVHKIADLPQFHTQWSCIFKSSPCS